MNKKLLKRLYSIHSPSGGEEPMRSFLCRYIEGAVPGADVTTDELGNIYVTRGRAATYPCVVAHIDQVQHVHSSDFRAIEGGGIIFGYSRKNRQFEGLGADDKNGVFIALELLREFDVFKCAFFVGEEVGCIGSSDCDMDFFRDCRFVLQPDRRGSGDLITTIGGSELCSREFVAAIVPGRYGYKEEHGLMTDVETLKCRGLEVSAINLSCGYYGPHTDNEFTVVSELENCLRFVRDIVANCTAVYEHKGIDYSSYRSYNWGSDWGFDDDVWEILMDAPDTSTAELMDALRDFYPTKKESDYEKAITEFKVFNSPVDTGDSFNLCGL